MTSGLNSGRPDNDDVAALVAELATSTEAFCALAAALALLAADDRPGRAVEPALADVLAALGLSELLTQLDRADLVELHGAVEARLEQAYEWTVHPKLMPASRSVAADTMATYELAAGALASLLRSRVVSQLRGLQARLATRAMLLIAGVGAGGLVIALCELWPTLWGVGIDIDESAIERARQRVEQAGLSSRIELRVQDVTELSDRDAYDLVWLPAGFIGRDVLPGALGRVRHATRSGGWVIVNVFAGPSERAVALARLRAACGGGTFLWPDEARSLLRQTGWADVWSLPRDVLPSIWMTAGRRR